MPSSAIATYFAVNQGNTFRYVFLLRNTSSGVFDIYSLLIDAQYDVPFVPGVLQNIVPLSAPQGWQLIPSVRFFVWPNELCRQGVAIGLHFARCGWSLFVR